MTNLTPRHKYHRIIVGVADQVHDENMHAPMLIDVYDVLEAYKVVCPALQHLIKKALCAGLRGHKDAEQDLKDILSSAQEAIRLHNARQLTARACHPRPAAEQEDPQEDFDK